jgi:hypothetical protein
VFAALADGDQRRTALGMIRIDRAGDPTIKRFGIYRLGTGQLTFLEAGG